MILDCAKGLSMMRGVVRVPDKYWLQEPKTMASKLIYVQENGFAKR
jgi:hypothetical protein